MNAKQDSGESRVAVLVDCDNVQPAILEHALRFVAQFGRVVVRRGYGNNATLSGNRWQEALVQQAFTPCLQYQYASGKNTADIALALDALELLFDETVDTFCVVTSDSDFAYLCRKLRERGAIMCIVGEAKTPQALRNSSDYFSEWESIPQDVQTQVKAISSSALALPAIKAVETSGAARQVIKRRPLFVVEAVTLLAGSTSDGKVDLSALGNYLRRADSSFTAQAYGHSGLLDMLRTYDLLQLSKETAGNWKVKLNQQKLDQELISEVGNK